MYIYICTQCNPQPWANLGPCDQYRSSLPTTGNRGHGHPQEILEELVFTVPHLQRSQSPIVPQDPHQNVEFPRGLLSNLFKCFGHLCIVTWVGSSFPEKIKRSWLNQE